MQGAGEVRRQRTGREVTLAFEHRLNVTVAEVGCDVALVVPGVRAHQQGHVVGLTAPPVLRSRREAASVLQTTEVAAVVVGIVDRVLAINFDALEVLAHDEVHDAGFSVRTVHRRGAARQNFDVVDESRRDVVQVGDRQERVARHQALAVHEDQRAGRTEVTKVDGRRTGRAVGLRVAEVSEDGRQVVQKGRNVVRTFELHFLLADRGNGRTRVNALLRDARTRDDHGFNGLVLGHCRCGNAQGCGGGCSEEQCRAQATVILIGFIHLGTPLVRS